MDPTCKILDLLMDDPFRLFRLVGPFLKVFFRDSFQIVDVINVDVVELVYSRIEISSIADVNEEHRSLLAFPEYLLYRTRIDDKLRRAGTADHEISHFEIAWKIFKQDGTPMDLSGQFYGALKSTIGDHETLNAVALQMAGHEIAHFASPNQHHCLVIESVEDSLREFHCNGTDRNGPARNAGFRAHPLGDGKGPMKQPM